MRSKVPLFILAAIGAGLALLWSAPSRADESLAVLDVETAPNAVTADQAEFVTNALRKAAVQSLGSRVRVMTRETIVESLSPSELRCDADSCMATVGRKLRAAYVLGASLVRSGSDLALKVEAYETASKALVGSKVFYGQGIGDLARELVSSADTIGIWISQRLDARAAALEKRLEGENTDFNLTDSDSVIADFTTEPPGATVRVDGRDVCAATPCSRRVRLGIHDIEMRSEWYEPVRERLRFSTRSAVRKVLAPDFGTLDLTTDPPGMAVQIDGAEVGLSPLTAWRLRPGRHMLRISNNCYQSQQREVRIEAGRPQPLSVAMDPVRRSIRLVPRFEGRPVVAGVEIDGIALDQTTPATFHIPACARLVRIVPRVACCRVAEMPLEAMRDVQVEPELEPLSTDPYGGNRWDPEAGWSWMQAGTGAFAGTATRGIRALVTLQKAGTLAEPRPYSFELDYTLMERSDQEYQFTGNMNTELVGLRVRRHLWSSPLGDAFVGPSFAMGRQKGQLVMDMGFDAGVRLYTPNSIASIGMTAGLAHLTGPYLMGEITLHPLMILLVASGFAGALAN